MKVIFLDFDGVINNWDVYDGVDVNNVRILKQIIDKTGAKVVATTSNKYSFQRDSGVDYRKTKYYVVYVQELNKCGIDIYDVTPYVDGNRDNEIEKYLMMHPEIEEFVILDDDYFSKKFRERQVFLDYYNGLLEEHLEPSLDILSGKLGFYPDYFDHDLTSEEICVRANRYHNSKKKNR